MKRYENGLTRPHEDDHPIYEKLKTKKQSFEQQKLLPYYNVLKCMQKSNICLTCKKEEIKNEMKYSILALI